MRVKIAQRHVKLSRSGKVLENPANGGEEMRETSTVLEVKQGEKDAVMAVLLQKGLWKRFDKQQNEMLLTPTGRRMFPVPEFELEGLDPKSHYSCELRIVSGDRYRYKYDMRAEAWKVSSFADGSESKLSYIHPMGVSLGKQWLQRRPLFNKLKLTNRKKPGSNQVVLSSLQKYKVQLIVTKMTTPHCERWVFDFPETEFIAVTCYQNPAITKLKIAYNPYAKAFRRTSSEIDDEDKPPTHPTKKRRLDMTSSSTTLPQSSCSPALPQETDNSLALVLRRSDDQKQPEIAQHERSVCERTPEEVERTFYNTKRLCHYPEDPEMRYIPVMADPFSFHSSTPMTSFPGHGHGNFRLEISGSFGNQETAMPWSTSFNQESTNQIQSWSPNLTNQNPFLATPVKLESANQMLEWSPMAVNHEQEATNHNSPWPTSFTPEPSNYSFPWNMTSYSSELLSNSDTVPGNMYSWKTMSGGCGMYDGYDVTPLRSYSRYAGSLHREN